MMVVSRSAAPITMKKLPMTNDILKNWKAIVWRYKMKVVRIPIEQVPAITIKYPRQTITIMVA